jgi:hypothetical protein
MKKLLTILLMLMCGLLANAQTWPPAGMQGSGEMEDPWQIRTAEHLHALALFVNASKENSNATLGVHYRLMNDIDLRAFLSRPGASPQGWLPIGKGLDIFGNERYAFQGHFDGYGHVVSGLWIRRVPSDNTDVNQYFNGLFGVIENATIDSVGVEVPTNDSIIGANFTGILVGQAYWNSTITKCYVKGKVVGQQHTGGMIGFLSGSHIQNCYAVVRVYGTSLYTGGLVGHMYFGSTIEYAYSTGYVEGHQGVGGLVGYVRHESPTIRNTVADQSRLGGKEQVAALVGENFKATPAATATNVFRSYVNRNVNTPSGSSGHHSGTAHNNAEFITQQFYTNAANWTGGAWDFNTIWVMPPYGHPVFKWQDLSIPRDIYAIVFVDDIRKETHWREPPYDIYEATIACDEDAVEVRIEVDLGQFVFIPMTNTTPGNTFRWTLPNYGDNDLRFKVKSTEGDSILGIIRINKPIPFHTVTRVYWNNTLTVVNNPDNNGGFQFLTYKWFEGESTQWFSTNQWWSIDKEGHRELSGTRQYRLELTALGVPGILYTCQSDNIFLGELNFSTYPNPVTQGGMLYVENDIDDDDLKHAVINVYNMNGQHIDSFPAMRRNYINAKYAKGAYILVLEGKDGLRKEAKIIVQ